MPRTTQILSTVVFLLSFSFCAFSEETMSWEQVVQEATERNPAVLTSKHSVEKADAGVRGSYSNFMPKLNGSLNYTQSSAGQVNVVGGGSSGALLTNSGANEQYTAGLNVSQNIFNGFADSSKLAQSRASAESARHSLAVAHAQLLYDLRVAFAKSIYFEDLTRLNKTVEQRRKENRDLVNLRYEGGTENKGNVLKSKVAHESAKLDVLQTQKNLDISRRNLALLLGRPAGSTVAVSGKLEVSQAPTADVDFRSLATQTPTHLQYEADRRVAEAGIVRSRSGFFPTLDINGSLSRQGTSFPPTTNRWSAGVTLTIPIFSGGSTLFDLQSSIAERDRSEAALLNADRQVAEALQQSLVDFQIGAQRATVQEASVEAAQLRAEIGRAKYANGLLVFENWDLIENDLITQEQQLLSARLTAVTAEANWKKSQGIGVTP